MSVKPTRVDWAALFFEPNAKWPEKLLTLANRRFAGTPDAESAYNFALEEVSANDWCRLREGYKGTGSAAGFLRITFVRLLEEYAVRKYGKKRPPVWLKRLGTMWVRTWEFLCLKRLMPETIVEQLTSSGEHPAELIRQAMTQIRGRIPGCGQYVGEWADYDSAQTRAETLVASDEPDAQLEETELVELLGSIASLLAKPDATNTADSNEEHGTGRALTLSERRDAVRARLDISANERLILRLIYHDGYTIPKAAKALRLHEQKVRRTHKKLMTAIREALEAAGLGAVALEQFLNG